MHYAGRSKHRFKIKVLILKLHLQSFEHMKNWKPQSKKYDLFSTNKPELTLPSKLISTSTVNPRHLDSLGAPTAKTQMQASFCIQGELISELPSPSNTIRWNLQMLELLRQNGIAFYNTYHTIPPLVLITTSILIQHIQDIVILYSFVKISEVAGCGAYTVYPSPQEADLSEFTATLIYTVSSRTFRTARDTQWIPVSKIKIIHNKNVSQSHTLVPCPKYFTQGLVKS